MWSEASVRERYQILHTFHRGHVATLLWCYGVRTIGRRKYHVRKPNGRRRKQHQQQQQQQQRQQQQQQQQPTNRPTNQPTNQPNKQTSKQTNKQTNKQTDTVRRAQTDGAHGKSPGSPKTRFSKK